MLNKALFTSAFIFSISAQASIATVNIEPIVKSPFPLSYSKADTEGLDFKNKAPGYLADFSKAYVDISKYFDSVESVCFEIDTAYSGSGSTPGMAGVYLYKYFVYSDTFRGDNNYSGSAGGLARTTFSKCFNENEGFAQSFVREGKIAFTPYTTDSNVSISDVRVQVSGISKIRGELVSLKANTNSLGGQTGEAFKHVVEPNTTYSIEIFENSSAYNKNGDKYSSLGVSYINTKGQKTIKAINEFLPTFVTTQGELSLFLVGDNESSQGEVLVNIKKVNID
ncbi:hypothetical protein [Pseudoalteromonas luteoviolacea]|uniref:hypothetical protein n=1 Tax=Pseudoalteromonas luteoviolacea TaxID=43657 RepID=UPI001151A1A0|nr:hypothetical protein [Pseudoalteromonas luteoviolacea]TQF70217.1 hypothetical protein FLM44_03755 [Pseudoalteromonas luteoviolacea]